MENDREMTEATPSRSAQANSLRMKLLVLLSLVAVFSAGLLLGRSRMAGSENREAQNASESKPASQTSEQKLAANQVRLSPKPSSAAGSRSALFQLNLFRQTLEATGRLAINEDAAARVGTIVTGRVTRVLATVGDFVKKGQALIYIHSHELLDARANAAKAQAAVTEERRRWPTPKPNLTEPTVCWRRRPSQTRAGAGRGQRYRRDRRTGAGASRTGAGVGMAGTSDRAARQPRGHRHLRADFRSRA